MSLRVLSYSYKNTPIELREKLAVSAEEQESLLPDLRRQCGLQELLLLSTCNRVEFYYVAQAGAPEEISARLRAFAESRAAPEPLAGSELELEGQAAVMHLFRVTSALESMVLGEPQILGQVKSAYQAASGQRSLGPVLTALMQRAFHAAKRVRTETQIARFPVSVSYAAAELAGTIFETLADKTVLVIGAGDMAELAIEHLQKAGANRLMVTNRTFANGVALAERYQGKAMRLEMLREFLPEADIVIAATGSAGFIIDESLARQAVRARRGNPMFFIDIAVPRDIDPRINDLADVYCYDIDDLQSVVDANRQERERQAVDAQQIIEAEIAGYERKLQSHSVVPVLKALRQHFSSAGERELAAALSQLRHLPEKDTEAVRRAMRTLVNRLLHTPSTRLKQLGEEQVGQLYGDALLELFGLSTDSGQEAPLSEAQSAEQGKVLHLPVTPEPSV